MLDMPFSRIIEGLNYSLENVIAPEIESPIAKGQLFAVVEILNQIKGRFDHKFELVVEDIKVSQKALATLIETLSAASVEIPSEYHSNTEAIDLAAMTGEELREKRNQLEIIVSGALDLLDAHRADIPDAQKVEHAVFMQFGATIFRNMLLVGKYRFDKITQADKKD